MSVRDFRLAGGLELALKYVQHPHRQDEGSDLTEVITRVMLKLKSGADVDFDALEAGNPHLMPELGERLHGFRIFKESVKQAKSQQPLPEAAIRDPELDEDMAALDAALPEYEILERIDRGGQGAVYKAYHGLSRKMVAVKLLAHSPGNSAAQRGRFDREVALLARIKHPNIISLTGHGLLDGRPYLITDYIDGLTLDDHVVFLDLPVRARVELFVKVCDAVHAAHQKGVLHRDLKPANIIVDVTGEPRILDFGLAKDLAEEPGDGSPVWTSHQRLVGTLPYLSPEQASQSVETGDVRSDVYTLGVMLFQIITDTLPYSVDGDARSVQRRIIEEKPRRLKEALAIDGSAEAAGYESAISDDLESILVKTLSKQPDARYRSAAHLADDLRCWLDGNAVEAKRGRRFYAAWRFAQRNRLLVGTTGILLLAIGTLAGLLIAQSNRTDEAQAAADQRGRQARSWSLASWNARLSDLRASQALRSIDGLDPVQSELVLARARENPVRLDQAFAQIADGTDSQLLKWVKDVDRPERTEAIQRLEAVAETLDSVARILEHSPVEFPLQEGVGFAIGRGLGALPHAHATSRIFLARAYYRFQTGDFHGSLADASAARLLAVDMAAGWDGFHFGSALSTFFEIYHFADAALLAAIGDADHLMAVSSWILTEPRSPLEDISQLIEYRRAEIQELIQASLRAAHGGLFSFVDVDTYEQVTNEELSDEQRWVLATNTYNDLEQLVVAYFECASDLTDAPYDTIASATVPCASILQGPSGQNPLARRGISFESYHLKNMRVLAMRSRLRLRATALSYREHQGHLPDASALHEALLERGDSVNPKTKEAWTHDQLAEVLGELARELAGG